MEYLIGVLLALATVGSATIIGFDRSRSFYPVILMVIASYYCLFAVIGGSGNALWQDAAIATLFAFAGVAGFRISLWLIVGALAAHGTMDLIHHQFIANPGVPTWWPGFGSAFDITAALYLAMIIALRSETKSPK